MFNKVPLVLYHTLYKLRVFRPPMNAVLAVYTEHVAAYSKSVSQSS